MGAKGSDLVNNDPISLADEMRMRRAGDEVAAEYGACRLWDIVCKHNALAVRFGFLVLVFWFWFRFFFSFLFFSPRDDHHESFHVIAYEPILSIHVSVI